MMEQFNEEVKNNSKLNDSYQPHQSMRNKYANTPTKPPQNTMVDPLYVRQSENNRDMKLLSDEFKQEEEYQPKTDYSYINEPGRNGDAEHDYDFNRYPKHKAPSSKRFSKHKHKTHNMDLIHLPEYDYDSKHSDEGNDYLTGSFMSVPTSMSSSIYNPNEEPKADMSEFGVTAKSELMDDSKILPDPLYDQVPSQSDKRQRLIKYKKKKKKKKKTMFQNNKPTPKHKRRHVKRKYIIQHHKTF